MISSWDPPNRPADMIKVDADIILAIHYLKSKLQFTVHYRHMYGHRDGKNKQKQGKRYEYEEEKEYFDYAMESESSRRDDIYVSIAS